jgi:hypothetical protein
MSEQMTCAEAEPLLPLVADGAIDPDSDPALFAHLASCPACQRAVASHDLIALAITTSSRRAQPQRRPSILRWWPYVAAASLLLAAGVWLAEKAPPAGAAVASAAPVTPTRPALAQLSPAAPADVIAVPRPDGSTLYLVRQGEDWLPLDPAGLDGPVSPAHSGGSGVQVRY